MCGDGWLVVVRKDAADKGGGFTAITTVCDVGAIGFLVAVFVVARAALVELAVLVWRPRVIAT